MDRHPDDAALLRRALDSLIDPVVVLAAVRDSAGGIVDFTYLDVNDAACRVNRRTREDTLGRRVLDLFPAHGELGLLEAYAAVAESGVPAVLNDQPYPDEAGTGEIRYFDIRATQAGDGVTLTWRDITDRYQARRALQHLQEQFRDLAEQASDIVYFTGPDRLVRWVSPAVEHVLGWRPDQLIGRSMAELLHPEDRARTEKAREAAYAGAQAILPGDGALQVRVRSATGGYRWVRGTGRALRDDTGAVVGGIGSWHDLDGLVRVTQALDADRQRMQETLDGLMDPVVYFQAVRDDTGTIVDFRFADVNAAACAYNRVTREELQGSLLSVRYPDMWPLGLFDDFVRVTEGAVSFAYDDWAYGTAPDGTPVLLDLRGMKAPEGLVVTFRDVTERSASRLALAESERRFRMLAENATDVVLEVDGVGTVLWCSPAVTSVLGWAVDEIVGSSILDLVTPESLGVAMAEWEQGGSGSVTVRARDGSEHVMAFHTSLTSADDGTPLGGVVGLSDITAIVRAQQESLAALRREARHQLSREEAAIGILLADLDGIVTYANPAIHRIMGVAHGDIVGQPLVAGSADAEDADAAARLVDDIRAGRVEHGHLRRRLPTGSGSHVWLDTFVGPLRSPTGDLDGLMIQVVDVTAEVANREALHRSAEHFRLLAENASDVVYETDTHGHITWVSPSAQMALGWAPDALLGTLALDLVHPEDRELVHAARAQVYGGDPAVGVVTRFVTLDGGVRYMSVSAHSLRAADGSVVGAVVGLHDVTAETRMRQRLERSERTFRTAMQGAPQGMALAGLHDVITDANPALEAILGTDKPAILGHRLKDFLVPADPPVPTCAEQLLASGETRITGHEHQLAGADGSPLPRWISHSVSLIRAADGTPLFFVHHVLEVTEGHLRLDDLGRRATHDALTGLLNRDGLMSRLDDWLPVEPPAGLALLFADLDGLKAINDAHGHAAGDAVLVAVAERIAAEVRRGDLVARIAGDEFVIVLDRIQAEADARAVADKVIAGACGPVPYGGQDLPGSISLGMAVAAPGERAEALLARADAALYRAKQAGRGRVGT